MFLLFAAFISRMDILFLVVIEPLGISKVV